MTETLPRSNRRRRWRLLLVSLVVLALSLVSVLVGPTHIASAHGAMTSPASRTYACYLEGPENPTTPACQAAVAAGGTQPLYDWFGVLRSDGAGRTRGFIPDGQLCSGGNTKYAAYDAPRADWPATTLQSGAQYTFVYGAWVPHPGSFRLYVTKDNYDPTKPLTWDEMEDQPFLTADPEPAVVDGAYHMTGQLPANKTGRHIIYSVWTRSDSTETFYGCSDVIFGTDGNYPTPTPTPLPTCTATVAITNTWQGGFQASITVKNTSSFALIPWTVSWNEPSGVTLTSGWNATVTQDGTKFIANAPDWQRTFAAGSTVVIGFVASGPSNPPPSGVTLNGATCT
jgi:predicted carbohydrate-binding protein with CBM5 and CBM33 domain